MGSIRSLEFTVRRLVISISMVAGAWAGGAAAAPGDLDTSFGNGGVALTSLQPKSSPVVAVQPDGKIVVATSLADYAVASRVFAVVRYLPDGTLDPSFGTGGVARTNFTVGSNIPTAIAVTADGRILVAGTASNSFNTSRVVAVARFDEAGALDATFGKGGKLSFAWLAKSDTPSVILEQHDGMILVGGGARTCFGRSCVTDTALARLDPSGTLDPSFGQGGKVVANLVGPVAALALEPDGSILAAGVTGVSSPLVTRFATAGSVETVAAGEGLSAASGSGDVAFQPDGRVIQATYAFDGSDRDVDVLVRRFTMDNALDSTFAGPLIDFMPDDGLYVESVGQTLLVEPSGRILVAGYADPSTSATAFGLARLNDDGTLDATFGRGGALTTEIPDNDAAQVTALALQPDGKIIAAGLALQAGNSSLALARYLGAEDAVPAQ